MGGAGRDDAARYLVVGPPTHGVVVHGLRLAAADPRLGATLVHLTGPSGVEPAGLAAAVDGAEALLVQVTDRLFGSTPEAAAETVATLSTHARLGLVLHDVPQPAEGLDWYARRRAAYGRLAEAATRLVVASGFERDLLAECVPDDARAALRARTIVVPLPLERRTPADPAAAPPPAAGATTSVDLAILGFLYPGKGVEDAIDVAAGLTTPGREVTVTNYGAPAEGHTDHAEELQRYAAARGVRFRVTGYLSDAAMHAAVRDAGVPLAPHRHISASGSVNTWVESGRRPVVRRSPYVTELAQRLPGTVTPADDLRRAVSVALDDPESTWLDPGVVVGPSWSEAAAAHAEVLEVLAALARGSARPEREDRA